MAFGLRREVEDGELRNAMKAKEKECKTRHARYSSSSSVEGERSFSADGNILYDIVEIYSLAR
jgi:hypothetical protein